MEYHKQPMNVNKTVHIGLGMMLCTLSYLHMISKQKMTHQMEGPGSNLHKIDMYKQS